WGGQMTLPRTPDRIQKRIDEITAYRKTYPESPLGMSALSYIDYARRAANAIAKNGTWQVDFNDIINTPLLAELSVMQTSDRQQFYVLGDIDLKLRTLGTQKTHTFKAIDPNDLTKRKLVTVDHPAKILNANEKPIKVPHAKVIANIADDIKQVDENNWEIWGIDLIERLRNNKEFEKDNTIVVQAILIQQALKSMNTVAGWALGDTYRSVSDALARQNLDQLVWWDLERPEKITEKTRDALRDTIAKIPPAADVKKLLADKKTQLFRRLLLEPAAMGVALKDDTDNWFVTAPAGSILDGNRPYAIVPGSTPTSAASLLRVGQIANGKLELYTKTMQDLPQGSLIYIVKP
ncbi:MAG: hypothetical protein FWD53_07460, partial [Phycisphaerales bacterium]|nr:hypothetical protein [Phycisphaerales bacterium]